MFGGTNFQVSRYYTYHYRLHGTVVGATPSLLVSRTVCNNLQVRRKGITFNLQGARAYLGTVRPFAISDPGASMGKITGGSIIDAKRRTPLQPDRQTQTPGRTIPVISANHLVS